MKKALGFGLLSLVLFSLSLCGPLMSTKIADIKNNPRNYVEKEVTVSGEVTQTFSLLVIKYFTVRDDSGEITVVTERPLPRQGQRLKIRGVVKEAFSVGTQSLLVIQEKPESESHTEKE